MRFLFLAGGNIGGWTTPDILGALENKDWFFVSDVAGVLRGFTGDVNWLTLIGLLVVAITAWLLWRPSWGLRLRSCGEDPWAAESLGVPVLRMKYYGVSCRRSSTRPRPAGPSSSRHR